jgi:hypothetical protein
VVSYFAPLDRRAQDIAERAVFLLAETAGVDLILRLANAMHGVLLDDAEFHSICENAAEETDSAGCGAGSTTYDSAPAELVGLDARTGLAAMMSFMAWVMSDLAKSHPSNAMQGDDVPLDAPHISRDRRSLLRPPSLAEHKPVPQIFKIAGAEFFDGDRFAIQFALLGGVAASCHLAEQDFRFAPGFFRSPDAVQTDGVAARAACSAVSNDVASFPRREDTQPETGQLLVPNEIVCGTDFSGTDSSFGQLCHARASPWAIPRVCVSTAG